MATKMCIIMASKEFLLSYFWEIQEILHCHEVKLLTIFNGHYPIFIHHTQCVWLWTIDFAHSQALITVSTFNLGQKKLNLTKIKEMCVLKNHILLSQILEYFQKKICLYFLQIILYCEKLQEMFHLGGWKDINRTSKKDKHHLSKSPFLNPLKMLNKKPPGRIIVNTL